MTCHPLNPPGFSAHKTGRIGDLPTKEEIRHLGSGAFGAAVLVRRLKDGRRLVAKKCSVKAPVLRVRTWTHTHVPNVPVPLCSLKT